MGEIMGLFDKVKNLFTEVEEPDEDDEIKVEQIVKETPRVHIEPKKEEEIKPEPVKPVIEKEEEPIIEEEEKKEEPQPLTREKTKTPIFFTEKDFDDLEPDKPKKIEKKKEVEPVRNIKREEKKGPYGGAYSSPTLLTKEKPTFKPTPIISPIYGILDKNYSKDDIVERKENNNRVKETRADKFDEVRNKAYGNLENELEETIYRPNSRRKNIDEEIDLFDELESEQNIIQEKPEKIERVERIEPIEKFDRVDRMDNLEKTAELAKTVNEQEKNIRELEEITMDLTKELDNLLLKRESYSQKKEKVEETTKEDDELLTENELFNLIDSMYEEGRE